MKEVFIAVFSISNTPIQLIGFNEFEDHYLYIRNVLEKICTVYEFTNNTFVSLFSSSKAAYLELKLRTRIVIGIANCS